MDTNQAYITTVCDGCGKKYGIELIHIKGRGVRFQCRQCNAIVTAQKPLSSREPGIQPPHLPNWVQEIEE